MNMNRMENKSAEATLLKNGEGHKHTWKELKVFPSLALGSHHVNIYLN